MESKEKVQNNEILNLNSWQFPSRIEKCKAPLSDRFGQVLSGAVAWHGLWQGCLCVMVVNVVVAMKCG